MAMTLRDGPKSWEMTRDEEGHRQYRIVHIAYSDGNPGSGGTPSFGLDGPYAALNTPGLPSVGSPWYFDNDFDDIAWCLPTATVTPRHKDGEPSVWWEIEQVFSTKPQDACRQDPILNPLLIPTEVTGSFLKYQKEATYDRLGKRIVNSAFEQIRGPQNEWDEYHTTVKIVKNVASLEWALKNRTINKLNESLMWGMPRRTIKFSNFSFEKKYHGRCEVYYRVTFDFEIRKETWDRDLLDEGTKCLKGSWNATTGVWDVATIGGSPADPLNPSHFDRMLDKNGNPMRVLLDGHGKPYVPSIAESKKWWCINDGEAPYAYFDYCAPANDLAWISGAFIKGPFDTEGAASSVCTVAIDEDDFEVYAPFATTCAENNAPGRVHVEYYQEASLLMSLRLTELSNLLTD